MTDDPRPDSPLSESPSPFLRHGAGQPVDWLPWGEEAFRRAREEDRPILLDIGAVWCHWCHVMDRESYEDPETAALINELYVPVKVDRDERPDVDARYQRAVQSLSGQGGWPLTAWLTPAGEVFHGGTYFPPRAMQGRPSFRQVLEEVARVWREDPGKVRDIADAVTERVQAVLVGEAVEGELKPGLLDGAIDSLAKVYDARHGGFGQAPKFPNAGGLGLLLDAWLDERSELARGMVTETLTAMTGGGVYDQLGGGFHRYSTDPRWIIPHFEKMAYDNGPLLQLLARTAAALDRPDLADAAAGIVAYYRDVAPELVEAGGFPASQDADIGFDDDGDYWTWTEAEVRDALGDDAEAAILRWGVRDANGAMHQDPERHVLFRAMSVGEVAAALDRDEAEVAAALEAAAEALKAARDARPRPYVDTTLFSGWVALVAAGHLAAARHLGTEGAGEAGLRALRRVWDEAWVDGQGVAHRPGDEEGVPQLVDQAYVAAAAVDAFEWSQDPAWLERARSLVAVVRRRFGHPSGGLTDRPEAADAEADVLATGRLEVTDAPEPSPTAVMAMTMARLGALDHDETMTTAARDLLRVYAGSAPRFAPNAGTFFQALRWVVKPVTTVVIVEEEGALLRAALEGYRPTTVVRRYRPGAVDTDRLPEPVAAMLTGDAPRAYVCVGTSCAPPVSRPAELQETLATFGR
ncbi:MAG: thioredoxin domain-containing protein [Longimicrobiales bacterium]|nr:thioredoxin domain-containing protein [Longimicrobiales bacterium]